MAVQPAWVLEITDVRLAQIREMITWLIGRDYAHDSALPEVLDRIRSAQEIIQRVKITAPRKGE